MNRVFEVQRIESSNSVWRAWARQQRWLTPLNVVILVFGFTCIGFGYALSHTSPEKIAAWLGRPSTPIEHTAPAPKLGNALSRISKTWVELLG
jgi:hypothetical protein